LIKNLAADEFGDGQLAGFFQWITGLTFFHIQQLIGLLRSTDWECWRLIGSRFNT